MALLRDPRFWPAGRPPQQPFPIVHSHQVLPAHYKLSTVAVPPRRSNRMGNSNSHQSVYLTQPPVMAGGFDPRMVDPRSDPRFRGDPRYGDVMQQEEEYYRGRGDGRKDPSRKGDKRGLLGRKAGKSASPAASLERRLGMSPHNKVLPDVGVISPKEILRPTELGSILHNGGTITGRRRELLLQQEAAASKQKQPRSNSSPRLGQERATAVAGSGQQLEVKESSLPRRVVGKYDRVKSKSTILYPPEGRDEHYGSAPRAPSRSRDRSSSRGLDSRSIERLSSNGHPSPQRQSRPQSTHVYHPDFEPRASRAMDPRVAQRQDIEGPTKRPRSRKNPPGPENQKRIGYPAEDDINVDDTYTEGPLPNGRKSAAGVIDVDYRHGLSGGRKSASDFLSSIWRRGARTPDPLMEKPTNDSKHGRKRLFRPKSETRQQGANPNNWYPDTISSTGRQSAADIRGYHDDHSSTSQSRRSDRKREEKLSRNRAKSVDCLQQELEEDEPVGPKPTGMGNWMNAFTRSMTSLAPVQPNAPPPPHEKQSRKKSQRLFNPNDTIESCKSKASSRSARSKTSIKSENKRKSRRDALQAVADECRSPSRLDGYSAAPNKNTSHWRSIDNIFSRSKSRSKEVLDDPVDNKKPPKIEFGVQVLPRQFHKKEEVVTRSSSAEKKPKEQPKDQEGAQKKQFYFGMDAAQNKQQEENKSKGPSKDHSVKSRVISGRRSSSVDVKQRQLPEDEIERFASRLQSSVVRSESNDSYVEEVAGMAANSVVTSERPESANPGRGNSTMSFSDDEGDIPVKLRPVLPRKHLDMPRFSPMAAWRGIVTNNQDADRDPDYVKARQTAMVARQQGGRKSSLGNNSSHSSNEPELFEEQIIQKSTRQNGRSQRQFVRQRHEKSADSGISGDTGSPGPTMKRDPNQVTTKSPAAAERPLAASSPVHPATRRSLLQDRSCWTPEQDLDDSMNDGSHNGPAPEEVNSRTELATPPKLIHRNTMFSANNYGQPSRDTADKGPINKPPVSSKPAITDSKQQSFSSLRKLKRSVSNALHQDDVKAKAIDRLPVDDNWSMSRSVPNTLDTRGRHNSHQLMESWSDIEEMEYEVVKGKEVNVNKVTSIRTKGHIVYLPEYKSVNVSRPRMSPDHQDDDEYDDSVSRPHSAINESLEFAPPCRRRETSPGSEMPATTPDDKGRVKKGKKFTYQSTVRQIERKRLEQQLSRETEEKEKQRLREQEVIRKVEEEFKKKRNREKSSIQHQLNELRRSTEYLDQLPFEDDEKQKEDKCQGKPTNGNFFMAGKDTYAVPNKRPSPTSTSGGALVQVRPYKSSPISIGEKVGITSPPPPPMSPPPPLTSDDYLSEPAPVVRSSLTNEEHFLQGSVSPASGTGGFFKELKSRLTKGSGSKPQLPEKSPAIDMATKSHLKGQTSCSRSSGSLSPTRQDPDGAPASASASSIAGTSSHDKASPRSELNEMESSLMDSPTESIRREIVAAARSRNGAASPLSRSEESGSNRDESVDLTPPPGKVRSTFQEKSSAVIDKQLKNEASRETRARPSIYRQLEELVEREKRFEANQGSGKANTDGGSSSFSSMSATGGNSSRPTTSSSSYYSRHQQQNHAGKDLLMLVNSTDDGDDSVTTSVDDTSSCATPIVTAPPTLTKELSEFKEERRDYRDYIVPSNGPQNMWSPRLTPSPYGGISSRTASLAAGEIYGAKSEASLRTRSPGTRTPNSRRVGTPMSTHTQSSEKSLGLPVVSDNYRRDFVRSPVVGNNGPPPVPEKPVHYTHPEKVADLGKNPRVMSQPPPPVPGAPFVFH